MTTVEKQVEFKEKIQAGLERVYEKLIEFKKQKKSRLVIIENDKIVNISP